MRSLRVALAQANPTVGDVAGNARLVARWLRRAERAGADLALFPELTITGYPPEDLLLKRSFVAANRAALEKLAATAGETAAVVGFVDADGDGRLFNAAAVLWRRKVRGVYRKVLLPNYGVFDEKRYFLPGDAYPVFVVRGVMVGVSICEDAWVADGPVRRLARAGAEVVANINASPYHAGKGIERQTLFRDHATSNRVHFCYVQTVGGQDELVFDGDSFVYDPSGRLVVQGKQFAEELILCDLSLPERAKAPARASEVIRLSPARTRPPKRPALPVKFPPRMSRPEEVYSALVLGTRDYMRKNDFRTAVIGLSGGIDSSLVAVVAVDAIGAENVTGVAMPSRYSSAHSVEDAKELAGNLGIEFSIVPIESAHAAYVETLAEPFARPHEEVAEENIQSRIRGNILMALTNAFGGIVLTTGNKSEMATGYGTLYGDMAGGFAVIKDVPKLLVYEVSRWRNERGPAAIPEGVLTKPPSAELRPDQLDTDSLPPYEVLDPIIQAYVEDDRSIPEIVAMGFEAEIVRRVAKLVDRAEYKRRQAPPGVKITHRAFGKDRRLPITNHWREWAAPVRGAGKRRAR